jgi:hypothetical protein
MYGDASFSTLKKLLMVTYGLKTGWMGKVVESSFGLEDKII